MLSGKSVSPVRFSASLSFCFLCILAQWLLAVFLALQFSFGYFHIYPAFPVCLFSVEGQVQVKQHSVTTKGSLFQEDCLHLFLPLCFCHHFLCTWLSSSLARTPAVAFYILSLNCLFPSLIHTLYRSLNRCLGVQIRLCHFSSKNSSVSLQAQSNMATCSHPWPLSTCYMAGATKELNFQLHLILIN